MNTTSCPVRSDEIAHLARIDRAEWLEDEAIDLKNKYMEILKGEDEAKAEALMQDIDGYLDQKEVAAIRLAALRGEDVTQSLSDIIDDAAHELAKAAVDAKYNITRTVRLYSFKDFSEAA